MNYDSRDNEGEDIAHNEITFKNQPQLSQTTMGQYIGVKLSPIKLSDWPEILL